MTSYQRGQMGEDMASSFLTQQGFKVLAKNWRTRRCEIDIVAQKNQRIYLVEVKYRSSDRQGQGLDYITPQKLKQMAFAAEVWVAENNWQGDYQLAVVSVDNDKVRLLDEL